MYVVYYTKYGNIFSKEIDHTDLGDFADNFDWEHGDIISITMIDYSGEFSEE